MTCAEFLDEFVLSLSFGQNFLNRRVEISLHRFPQDHLVLLTVERNQDWLRNMFLLANLWELEAVDSRELKVFFLVFVVAMSKFVPEFVKLWIRSKMRIK